MRKHDRDIAIVIQFTSMTFEMPRVISYSLDTNSVVPGR